MPKFIKKPVEIEAWQWTGYNISTMIEFLTNGEEKKIPDFENNTIIRDNFIVEINDENGYNLYINTLEGKMFATPGDFIIKGVDGEFYPCKLGIFLKTYDKVE